MYFALPERIMAVQGGISMNYKKDWLLRITGCIAAGGLFMMIIMCLLIGFGFGTLVGREAVALYILLQAVNLVVIRQRERRMYASAEVPKSSQKMRRVRGTGILLWWLGAGMALLSFGLLFLGVGGDNLWVQLSCWAGVILTLLGWLIRLAAVVRMRQSALAYAVEEARKVKV